MSIDIFSAAQRHSFAPHYTDRSWLAVELGSLIERAAWEEIGGLLGYVALVAAPLARGLAARVVDAQALAPLSAGMGPPSWADSAWVTSELALHVAAMVDPNGDLAALAIRAAGVVARIEVPS